MTKAGKRPVELPEQAPDAAQNLRCPDLLGERSSRKIGHEANGMWPRRALEQDIVLTAYRGHDARHGQVRIAALQVAKESSLEFYGGKWLRCVHDLERKPLLVGCPDAKVLVPLARQGGEFTFNAEMSPQKLLRFNT